MKPPILSICIPTYNRAIYLDQCLASLCLVSSEVWQEVEVVISDNASTDTTSQIVERYQARLPIRYFRNSENIGGERNFVAAALRANGGHVWVFGDDDIFEPAAILSAIEHIKEGFDLIVLNYSLWSLDMTTKRRVAGLPFKKRLVLQEHDSALAILGSFPGYISCVVARKNILTSVSAEEYEPFIQYGFSHLYSTYAGLLAGGKAVCLPKPVFRNREDNSQIFLGAGGLQNWVNYFIYGTALVFDALEKRGYSRTAVISAKSQVLRYFVYRGVLGGLPGIDRRVVRARMIRLYRWNWLFWVVCLPGLLLPRAVLRSAREGILTARGWVRRGRYA